jgi:hypothetical protein
MNNAVLDVAIGLVFIYLLYSLLATTIKEIVAAIFSYRGRMLERGIEQMLDGQNHSYYWWNKLYNWLKLKIFLRNPSEESKQFKKASLFTAQVTKHPLYVRSSEDSLLSKKPAYLSSATFSDILIDLLSPQTGRPVLLKDISANINRKALDNADPFNKEAAKILNIYAAQANGDLQRFKLLIENWYDDTMDRVSGWYKKQASRILLIIGFFLAMTFNVDSIEIVKKLSADKDARAALVKSASEYIQKHTDDANKVKTNRNADTPNLDNSQGDPTKAGVDKIKDIYKSSIEQQNVTLGLGWGDNGFFPDTVKWIKDSLLKEKGFLAWISHIENYDSETQKLKDEYSKISKSTKLTSKRRAKVIETRLKAIDGDLKIAKDSLKYYASKNIGTKPVNKNPFSIALYIIWHTISNPLKWIGFLITGLAISLGSPFWFDLLNKFINLRASGKKPDDDGPSTSKTTTLNQKPAPNSFA